MTRNDSNDSSVDLESAGACELAAAVAARRVSALELCDAAIRRIEHLDGDINAVVVRDFDRARAAARACDALPADARLPLRGVPMTVKESFDVAGLPTSWGLPPFRQALAQRDAVLVARLKAAGAVILGKTNLAAALADWQTDNPVYGRTQHPLDATRTPGGSSGGSGAALAAGMVSLELGSDIGGSIRVPAHFCGVFGHKPSYGLLPARGHAFPLTDGAPTPIAVCGPLARTARDLQRAFDVLAGPDEPEAVGYALALPPPRHASLVGCRVALLDELPSARADASVRDALAQLAQRMQRAGARVEPAAASLLPDLRALQEDYETALDAVFSRGDPSRQNAITVHEWFSLLDRREHLRRHWRRFFDTVDVLLMPIFGTPAFQHIEEPDWDRRTLMIDGLPRPYAEQLAWSGLASLAGLPATAVPAGKSREGLPIGVQVVGAYLEDLTTLAVARQIEALGLA